MTSVGVQFKRLWILIAVVTLAIGGQVRGISETEESFGQRVKKFFIGPPPTPTPAPHYPRKKSTSGRKKKAGPKFKTAIPMRSAASTSAEPSSSPTTATSQTPAALTDASPRGSPTESTPATETPEASPTPQANPSNSPGRRAELIEPVRAITPGPRARRRGNASPSREETSRKITPSSEAPSQRKAGRNAPTPITANDVVDYDSYPSNVRKVLDLSLSLTNENLGYKYGSADPAKGGMDCSGFIYYVLTQSGIKDPPRDAREQYTWIRKAGNFQAVLGHSNDTFEIDALKPGDLLLWSGTNPIAREPDITDTMIYLGREKGTNRRLMVGASDGRPYKGQPRFGVSVLDFEVVPSRSKSKDKATPVFVGYGRIPDLPNE
jgi:cell wall-associated NlpC family hydrolase